MKYFFVVVFINLCYNVFDWTEGKYLREMYNEIDLDMIDIDADSPLKEPARQYYFMAKCREWVRVFEGKNGRRPAACIQTFDCPFV